MKKNSNHYQSKGSREYIVCCEECGTSSHLQCVACQNKKLKVREKDGDRET